MHCFTGKELSDETSLYDFSARLLQTNLGRFTTIDPLAEKYPNISPYAYCNGNPVNFVDPDGEVPVFVLPFIPILAKAVAITSAAAMTIWVLNRMERRYNNSKYNPGYKHQERQDKRNKRELDQAQLNVQNSINQNFNKDNNDMPSSDPEKKGPSTLFLLLNLIYETCIDPNTQKPKESVVRFLKGENSANGRANPEPDIPEHKEEIASEDKFVFEEK